MLRKNSSQPAEDGQPLGSAEFDAFHSTGRISTPRLQSHAKLAPILDAHTKPSGDLRIRLAIKGSKCSIAGEARGVGMASAPRTEADHRSLGPDLDHGLEVWETRPTLPDTRREDPMLHRRAKKREGA